MCDVYDALVSERVYRPAWSVERALEHLRSEVGTAFDARCVAALEKVVARERPAEAARAGFTAPIAVPSPATA